MKTRILAAAVGLGGLIPALIWGGALAVEILIPLVIAVVITEYAAMAFPDDKNAAMAWLFPATAVAYGVPLYVGLEAWGPALLLLAIAAMIAVTLRPGPELSRAADRFTRLYAGTVWLTLLTCIPLMRRLEDGLAWVFLVLAISWCGDTGGYFAGRFFGRNKLYPRISPKKTWEGVVGGVVFATGGVFVVRHFGLPGLSPLECVGLGTVLCLAGVVGDLSESMLKRSFDVKDSGWIMPGHGGLLDRIDSVLFVAPLVYTYAMWMA
jgi:phosphatidate cytidylyltransferase